MRASVTPNIWTHGVAFTKSPSIAPTIRPCSSLWVESTAHRQKTSEKAWAFGIPTRISAAAWALGNFPASTFLLGSLNISTGCVFLLPL